MVVPNVEHYHNVFITCSFSTSSSHTVCSGFTSDVFSYFALSSQQTEMTQWCLSPFFVFSSSTYSPSYHAVKRESETALGDPAALENERQIYKSVLEGGDIPFQGLSGLKRPSSSASTRGGWSGH